MSSIIEMRSFLFLFITHCHTYFATTNTGFYYIPTYQLIVLACKILKYDLLIENLLISEIKLKIQ